MRPITRRTIFLAGTCLLALVLACVVLMWVAEPPDPHQQYEQARGRWQTHAPAHYRLLSLADPNCTLDAEIQGDRITTVYYRDPCHPLWTIDDLFEIARQSGVQSYNCISYACTCRLQITMIAEYDPELGYPTSITIRSQRSANWLNTRYWQQTINNGRQPACERRSQVELVRVRALTPIP